jgi:DNA-binding transcriptional regulator YiaG
MEMQATYKITPCSLRRECLLPIASGWVAPNANELAFVLSQAGMSIRDFAVLMGVDQNYANSWLETGHKVPYALWSVLCICAGYGQIWRWKS